jgi:hypothetical protein
MSRKSLTRIIAFHGKMGGKMEMTFVIICLFKFGLSIHADKTKHMVMSRDQNAGRSHYIKADNNSFESLLQDFKYLGITLTDQNAIQEEITTILKSGNACYHLVQNVLFSSLLSKNLKIKIYRTVLLPVVSCGCETWSLTLREERTCRLRVFENRVLR